jgi:exonuclease VII large subunit
LSKRAQASQVVEQDMRSVWIEGEVVALIQLRTSLSLEYFGLETPSESLDGGRERPLKTTPLRS